MSVRDVIVPGGGGGGATFSAGFSTMGNTAGDTGVVSNQVVFVGSDNITLSGSTNGGSLTLSIIGGAGAAAGSNTLGMSNLGNTSGTSGVISGSDLRYLFAGGNNITLSQSINGESATLTISAFTQTLQTQSRFNLTLAGNSTSAGGGFALISSGVMTLAGGNNVTLSQDGNAVTISGPNTAAQSVESQSIGMSSQTAGGATAGTAGYASGGQVLYHFAPGSNITMSQSVNGASGTLSIYGASGGAGAAPTLSFWHNFEPCSTVAIQLENASLQLWPLCHASVFPGNMTALTMMFNVSGTVSTGAGFSRSLSVGFYTWSNSTRLDLAFSASTSWGTGGANANINNSMAGWRWITIDSSQFNAQPAFSQTMYWVGLWERSSGGSQSFSHMRQFPFLMASTRSGTMGAGSESATSNAWVPWMGRYTASFSTAMPGSLAASDVQKNASHALSVPHLIFNNMGSKLL